MLQKVKLQYHNLFFVKKKHFAKQPSRYALKIIKKIKKKKPYQTAKKKLDQFDPL